MSTEALRKSQGSLRAVAAEHPGGAIAAIVLGAIALAAALAPADRPAKSVRSCELRRA